MDAHEYPDMYTRVGGVREDGFLFYTIQELWREKNQGTILLLNSSPFLVFDLLGLGARVVYVHNVQGVVVAMGQEIERHLGTEEYWRRFGAYCLGYDDETVCTLARGADIVVCVEYLHHLKAPRTFLRCLMDSPAALVVVDTTVEKMNAVIMAEMMLHGEAQGRHLVCRDAAKAVGFHTEADILGLWDARSVAVPPAFFQYTVSCPWCGPKCSTHHGGDCWGAMWHASSNALAFGS